MPTRPNLTVIRCADIDVSVAFYRLIGLNFEKHRHGSGLEHFAAFDGTWTFELYPASPRYPDSSSARIGFAVDSCDDAAEQLRGAGFVIETAPANSPWGRRAVALDPDGHRVELSSPTNE
ncbi:VOC family protein [Luteolibacter marinus]|uniref:VOC family protein n=1 Tax=Luteolibacter marinus TaxID=2776705 RepID=UPI001866E83B